MHFIEIAYMSAALVSLSACIPQIRTLLIKKNTDEFNTATWAAWLCTQLVTLAYVASIGSLLMVIVNICWVSFYAAMVGLILYYDKKNKHAATFMQPELAEEASI